MKLRSSVLSSVLGAFALLANSVPAAPGDTATAVPVPWTTVQISGVYTGSSTPTATYRAYTVPGDPIRIVVPEPNTIDEQLIYAEYAGFKLARQELIALAGIDTPDDLRPVDVFITGCTWTGYYQAGTTGFFGIYNWGNGPCSYIALFTADKPNLTLPFTPANAVRAEAQLLGVHEYTHLLFARRCATSPIFEDVCKACSFYISGYWISPGNEPAYFYALTDPADEKLNIEAGGRWIYELGKHHGASWAHLRRGFREIAAKFDAGGGESASGRISENQIRWILNAILVDDTKPAFLAAGVPEANLPTRSIYFPYVATGGVYRTTFRFPAPAGTKGKLEGLLYLYDAAGQPQAATLTAVSESGLSLPDKNDGPIHAVVTTATATRLLQGLPTPGKSSIGWARFDSLAPIDATVKLRRDTPPLSPALTQLTESGVVAATSFTVTASTPQQTVAIVNPGTAPIKVAVYASVGFPPSKAPLQTITIDAGHQYVGTVAGLTLSQKYKGKLHLQSAAPFAAFVLRSLTASAAASSLELEEPTGK